jgi:hypothetical protein
METDGQGQMSPLVKRRIYGIRLPARRTRVLVTMRLRSGTWPFRRVAAALPLPLSPPTPHSRSRTTPHLNRTGVCSSLLLRRWIAVCMQIPSNSSVSTPPQALVDPAHLSAARITEAAFKSCLASRFHSHLHLKQVACFVFLWQTPSVSGARRASAPARKASQRAPETAEMKLSEIHIGKLPERRRRPERARPSP